MTPPMLANIITWVAVKTRKPMQGSRFFPGWNSEGRFCCDGECCGWVSQACVCLLY